MNAGKEEEAPDATTDDGGSIFDKGKSLFQSLTKNDAPMAVRCECFTLTTLIASLSDRYRGESGLPIMHQADRFLAIFQSAR